MIGQSENNKILFNWLLFIRYYKLFEITILSRRLFLQSLNIIRHNETCSGGKSVKRSQPIPESGYYL